MKGPRIMVFQMKEIIKIGMIALIGLILICFLIFFLMPKKGDQAVYTPGTYSAQIVLHSKPVNVDVTVNESKITGVVLNKFNTTQQIFYPLFEPTMNDLADQIIKYQSTKIASSPENAVTSRILLDAVDAALKQAVVTAEAIK